MNSRLTRLACVAILPAALILAGCDKTIDSGDLEGEIAKNIKQQVGETVTVSCPDDITAKKGKTFTCKVTRKTGAPVIAKVTLLDNEGKFSYALAAAAVTTTPVPTPTPTTTTP